MAAAAAAANLAGKQGVRVVVIGDPGTGKSSLVVALATEQFPENVPRVMPPTRLPADYFPDRVPITIIDTSSSPEQKPKLIAECQAADAVVLTYACDRPATLERLSSFWLPEFRRLQLRAPVILVGCKLDLRDEQQISLEQVMAPIMQTFREIETCIECSALRQIQVSEVFYYAVKAVLHPTAPLFDQEAQSLKPRCVRALKRIFILCDHDRDGALSDVELNDFQVRCFSAPLQPTEISGVKRVVQEKMPEGVNDNGLTLTGFLFLHALFIEKGRLETTWTVLRKFGYDNDIKLRDDLIPTAIKRSPDQASTAAVILLMTLITSTLHSSIPHPAYASVQPITKTGGLLTTELLSSGWAGFFAGCLHTLSGPDHLVALAPLSIGRSRMESGLVGALWGCGHDAGQVIFGLLFLLLKDRLHIEVLRTWGTRVVGLTLLIIGGMGIREASEVHESSLALAGVDCNMSSSSEPLQTPAAPRKKKVGFATFATGVVHGLHAFTRHISMCPYLSYFWFIIFSLTIKSISLSFVADSGIDK